MVASNMSRPQPKANALVTTVWNLPQGNRSSRAVKCPLPDPADAKLGVPGLPGPLLIWLGLRGSMVVILRVEQAGRLT